MQTEQSSTEGFQSKGRIQGSSEPVLSSDHFGSLEAATPPSLRVAKEGAGKRRCSCFRRWRNSPRVATKMDLPFWGSSLSVFGCKGCVCVCVFKVSSNGHGHWSFGPWPFFPKKSCVKFRSRYHDASLGQAIVDGTGIGAPNQTSRQSWLLWACSFNDGGAGLTGALLWCFIHVPLKHHELAGEMQMT